MAIPALLQERGVDASHVLGRVGIDPHVFSDAASWLPFDVVGRIIAECATATACPHFGLLLGMRSGGDSAVLAGDLARNADTVGSGLRLLLAHMHLHDRGGVAALTEISDDQVEFSYAIYHANTPGIAEMMDGIAASLYAFVQRLCGSRWAPTEVRLARRRPRNVAPYRSLFCAPLRFDAPHTSLLFPAHWLDQPIDGADPAERTRLLRLVPELEAERPAAVTEEVIRTLSRMVISMPPSRDKVAEVLGMKPRTLREQLRAEGASVKELLEDVRCERARQLLEDSRMPIGEIAASLHYSTPGAFSRAFKAWTGKTPRQWRQYAVSRGS